MTFLEFKKRTRKTKPKEAGQAPASQATDQGNPAKNATVPDAGADKPENRSSA